MVRHYCDRCKKEIEIWNVCNIKVDTLNENMRQEQRLLDFELCKECSKEYKNWMVSFFKLTDPDF